MSKRLDNNNNFIQHPTHTHIHPTPGPSQSYSICITRIPFNMSSNHEQERRPGHCMMDGTICCYTACDYEDFVCGCAGTCDCICIRQAVCCAIGYDSLGCGIVTNESRDECCKIGMLCCECGMIQPSTCCSYASQWWCCQSVASLPFHPDYVNDVVCGMCFLQCYPHRGCCVAPPVAKAFTILKHTQSSASAAAAAAAAEPMERM